jgi:hypothetical protein
MAETGVSISAAMSKGVCMVGARRGKVACTPPEDERIAAFACVEVLQGAMATTLAAENAKSDRPTGMSEHASGAARNLVVCAMGVDILAYGCVTR